MHVRQNAIPPQCEAFWTAENAAARRHSEELLILTAVIEVLRDSDLQIAIVHRYNQLQTIH